MSIRDEINYWLGNNRLYQVFPRLTGASVHRTLFVTDDVNRLIQGPWKDKLEEYRCGKLWAAFDRFVEGRLITMARRPFRKPKTSYLARIAPVRDEVWDIRVLDPHPGLRIFGRFSEQDTFVALTWAPREILNNPADWRRECQRSLALWRQLFHNYQPIKKAYVHAYLSANAVPV